MRLDTPSPPRTTSSSLSKDTDKTHGTRERHENRVSGGKRVNSGKTYPQVRDTLDLPTCERSFPWSGVQNPPSPTD